MTIKNYSLTTTQLGEIVNPLLLDQSINMTYTSSGSSGIQVVNNNNINFGTNSFSLHCVIKVPDWTPAAEIEIMRKWTGTLGYLFRVEVTGKFQLYLNGVGNLRVSSISLGVLDGTTHALTAVITVGSENTTIDFYVDGLLLGTQQTVANVGTIDNTNLLYIMGTSVSQAVGSILFLAIYNRALSASDVLDLYNNGIHFSDKWGSQTPITSGTLETGKNYIIDTYVAGDDFTNVGGTNVSGSEFTATGTTPTTWTNSSSLRRTGATLALESPNIQPSPGQWLDSSTNKLHALQPLTGSSLTLSKRDFQVRGTVTWAGSHELKHITGIDQAVLPPNAYIESIIGVITGATIEDIIIGDGSAGDRFVTLTTGLAAGIVSFAIANHITDGTNYKLTVDPDANFTGSIAFTIKGYIIS